MTPLEIRKFANDLDEQRDDMPRHMAGDVSAAVVQLHYIASIMEREGYSGTQSKGPTPDRDRTA